MLREDLGWLLAAVRAGEPAAEPTVGASADVLAVLRQRGACFRAELPAATGRLPVEVDEGLWDLVARGVVTADAFSAVRSLLSARDRWRARQRRRPAGRVGLARRRAAVGTGLGEGRWALLGIGDGSGVAPVADTPGGRRPEPPGRRRLDELAEAVAWQLLARWGVVAWELWDRESFRVPWREVVRALRRLEARGQALGGRFVAGLSGEQYALPEAAELLAEVRRAAGTRRGGGGGGRRSAEPDGHRAARPPGAGRPTPSGDLPRRRRRHRAPGSSEGTCARDVRRRARIDLNADIGEGPAPVAGDDPTLLAAVTTVHIACGFHAGDPEIMRRSVTAAVEAGVAVGAHPSYPDPEGFGRRPMDRSAELVADDVLYQIGALDGDRPGLRDPGGLGQAPRRPLPPGGRRTRPGRGGGPGGPGLRPRTGAGGRPAGAPTADVLAAVGLNVVAEAFCDRAYPADGTLVPRDRPGAVVLDPEVAARQAVSIAVDGAVAVAGGRRLPLVATTICLHGDTPGAPVIARSVRRALEAAGLVVAAPGR